MSIKIEKQCASTYISTNPLLTNNFKEAVYHHNGYLAL